MTSGSWQIRFPASPLHEPSDSVRSREEDPQFPLKRHRKIWQRRHPRRRRSSLTRGSTSVALTRPLHICQELKCPSVGPQHGSRLRQRHKHRSPGRLAGPLPPHRVLGLGVQPLPGRTGEPQAGSQAASLWELGPIAASAKCLMFDKLRCRLDLALYRGALKSLLVLVVHGSREACISGGCRLGYRPSLAESCGGRRGLAEAAAVRLVTPATCAAPRSAECSPPHLI